MSVYEELVGQSAAIVEIQRAAAAARSLSESAASAMTHAWLFTGPPGSGRSLAAKVLAAALECTGDIPGCGECAECKAVMGNNHPDITWVSTDLVTIKAEEVRQYVAQSYVAPTSGAYRIFIVEDADRMLARTSNVLLKAIEEPAPRTVWILCTVAAADLLPTIRSRTRNINLVTPSAESVARLLVSRDGVEPERALLAAQTAQSHIGVARALATDPAAQALRYTTLTALTAIRGVGDAALAAQLFLDSKAMYIGESGVQEKTDISPDIAAQIKEEQVRRMEALGLDPKGKVPAAVKAQIKDEKDNLKRRKTRSERDMFDRELIYMESFYRDVLVLQLGSDVSLINGDFREDIERVARDSSLEQTIARMDALNQARSRLRANVTPALAFEAALVQLL